VLPAIGLRGGAAVHAREVDVPLDAVGERIQRTHDVVAIQA
jgi:hypothetical protein